MAERFRVPPSLHRGGRATTPGAAHFPIARCAAAPLENRSGPGTEPAQTREGDLRHQHQCGPAHRQAAGNQPQVDFRFSATGNSVEQSGWNCADSSPWVRSPSTDCWAGVRTSGGAAWPSSSLPPSGRGRSAFAGVSSTKPATLIFLKAARSAPAALRSSRWSPTPPAAFSISRILFATGETRVGFSGTGPAKRTA